MRQSLRLRKRKILLSPEIHFRLPVTLTNIVDAPSNPDDIILLRDKERRNHLPQFLTENPDSAPKLRRALKVTISGINLRYVEGIILFQIKIASPKILKFLFSAGKDALAPFLFHFQIPPCGYHAVYVPVPLHHAETLPGLANLRDVKIF